MRACRRVFPLNYENTSQDSCRHLSGLRHSACVFLFVDDFFLAGRCKSARGSGFTGGDSFDRVAAGGGSRAVAAAPERMDFAFDNRSRFDACAAFALIVCRRRKVCALDWTENFSFGLCGNRFIHDDHLAFAAGKGGI